MSKIGIYNGTYDSNIKRVDKCPNCGQAIPTDSWLDCIDYEEVNFCFYCGTQIRDKLYAWESDMHYFTKYLEEDD